jgi:hypothetical protein
MPAPRGRSALTAPGDGPLLDHANPAALAVSGKPVAVTGPASDRTLSSVRLHGAINPSGFATAYHFEYGTSTNNLDRATETQILNDGFSENAIIAGVTELSSATTYYYRLVASNLLGQACGVIGEFTLFGAARIIRLADGKAAIDFLTLPGRTNLVQVSSNLVDWATVTFLLPTNGVLRWEEPETAFPARFFRLSLP